MSLWNSEFNCSVMVLKRATGQGFDEWQQAMVCFGVPLPFILFYFIFLPLEFVRLSAQLQSPTCQSNRWGISLDGSKLFPPSWAFSAARPWRRTPPPALAWLLALTEFSCLAACSPSPWLFATSKQLMEFQPVESLWSFLIGFWIVWLPGMLCLKAQALKIT